MIKSTIMMFVSIVSIHLCSFPVAANDISWWNLENNKVGKITAYYRINEPFTIDNKSGAIKGLEYEIMMGFKYFLLNNYGYNLDINWELKNNLTEIHEQIKDSQSLGDLALDLVTEPHKQKNHNHFSNPYFPDLQVLITSRDAVTVESKSEFSNEFDTYTAVALKHTSGDVFLHQLKKELGIDFNIRHLESGTNLIDHIEFSQNVFGYVDLPNYILALDNNRNIKRQNLLSSKGIGYCLIMKEESGWDVPFNEYLESQEFRLLKKRGIQKYLGYDVNKLINHVENGENEEVVLLQKEKNYFNEELYYKQQEAEEQNFIRNILLVVIILALTITYFLYNSNKVKSKANEILTKHRQMIEKQNLLLSRRNNELVNRDEEKNNFIHILSHDLRAPINNITALANILKLSHHEGDDEETKMIDHILTESKRLNKMVTKILDIEKIESKTPEQFTEIELNGILEKAIDTYDIHASAKGIEIISNLSAATSTYILGEESYLFHVFDNLLSNAIKFSPREKKVYLNLMIEEHLALVKIRDEGPGMSEEDQKNMFKKFQVLSAKATAGERSTGLGLSIVDKYIGLLGGELECESEEGKGTTFIVKLNLI